MNLENMSEEIKNQVNDMLRQAYRCGYDEGKERALEIDVKKYIEQGRNEAWLAARKIALDGFSMKELTSIFSTNSKYAIFDSIVSGSVAIELIRAYEEQKKQESDSEIRVGDEVYLLDENYHSVVTCIYDSLGIKKAVCITQNGKWDVNDIDNLHKTSRHFPQIAEVLKKMQEGE